jgi:hypothetical protein
MQKGGKKQAISGTFASSDGRRYQRRNTLSWRTVMSLGFKIDTQCPKCYTDRTLLDTSFALPGHIDPQSKDSTECVNLTSALPVRLVFCPRCHYLEMYHDVG